MESVVDCSGSIFGWLFCWLVVAMMIKWIIVMTFTAMLDSGDIETRELGLSQLNPSQIACEKMMELSVPEWMDYYKNIGGSDNVEFRCMEVMFR